MSEREGEKDEVVELTTKHGYGTWRRQKGWRPLHVVDAEGCYFYDAEGRRYLDFSSQLMCSNLGHKNKALIDAVCRQAQSLPYISPAFTCDVRAELNRLLLGVMPRGLEKYFYSTSGTEANEAALKIARLRTGKYKVVSRYLSYHGSTAASISVTGDFRRWFVEPAGRVIGVAFAPDAYCYRCPLGLKYPDCGVACAEYVDYLIKNERNVAAVIVEPVVGTNGVLVPPDEYLPRLREITEQHGVLLVVDEVMCGWGRTGEWFAVDHWGVKPDILTTAKGLTGAYTPLGLTATTREVAEHFEENYFPHGHTYEAHPLAMAPAVAAINEIRRRNLVEKAREHGQYVKRRLEEIMQRHPSVGDVRGLGLFWAVEIVKNRETKKPFNTAEDKFSGRGTVADRVAAEALKRGVYLFPWISHFVVAPPLTVTREQVDEGLNVLDEALKISDAEVE